VKYRKWIVLAALPVAIGLLYGLDLWLERARQVASSEFRFARLFLLIPVINVLYAAILFGLFWVAKQPPQRWIGVVYAITGVVVLTYPALRMTVLANLPVAIRDVLPISNALLNPDRGLWLMGAFILVAGGWMTGRKEPVSDNSPG
jgi:hypothetical protein